ncbi:hypothetical protein BDY24DRAFT_382659 [Mrakia frigida]|uniref:uncharacterized protein n=1 Tax=Mrakia frigida TaxID=29902 RepID=UPI003FCBEFDA
MHISRLTQLILASPSLLAAVVMSLSGLPGRQGLGDALRSNCSPTPSGFSPPLLFAQQGVRIDWGPVLTAPERLSCQLVTLFEAAAWPPSSFRSSPPQRVILILWISYLPTIIAIIHLASYRNRVSWLPPVLGFYQWAAAALCFPLFSSLLLPRALPPSQKQPFSKTNIEGLVVGLVVGYLLPSYVLLFEKGTKRQEWTLGWQFFPIWVWVVQYAWVWVRGRGREGEDASTELRSLGVLCASSSFIGHLLVFSNLLTHRTLAHLLPPNGIHTLPTHSLLQLAHHTLAWDLIITHLSVCMTVVCLGSRTTAGGGGGVMGSTTRVLMGTLVGGLGFGVGLEWWRNEAKSDGKTEEQGRRGHVD